MDSTTWYCRMPRCPLFGQVAPQAPFTWHDWHQQAPRWRCRACRALVSARIGTAYAGIRTASTTYNIGKGRIRGEIIACCQCPAIRQGPRMQSSEKMELVFWFGMPTLR